MAMVTGKFNLNQGVRVKFTDAGRLALGQHPEGRFLDSQIDSEGFLDIQMWKLMAIFGSRLYPGSDPFVEFNEVTLSVEVQ